MKEVDGNKEFACMVKAEDILVSYLMGLDNHHHNRQLHGIWCFIDYYSGIDMFYV